MSGSVECPICRDRARDKGNTSNGGHAYDCEVCGQFVLSGTLEVTLRESLDACPDNRAVLSHAVRQMQREDHAPQLTTYSVEDIFRNTSLPKFAEQVDRMVVRIGDLTKRPGRTLALSSEDQALVGAESPRGLGMVIDHLVSEGLIADHEGGLDEGYCGAVTRLTPKGWARYEDLKRGSAMSRTAFMAMQFGDATLDKVVDTCFRPAVAATGFELRKLDDGQPAGLIDQEMEVRIRLARFVVVDLSHGNRGAYWEAGFARGLGKPVIYTCEAKSFHDPKLRPHFDTNHHVTVVWDASDLHSAAKRLKAIIRATLPSEARLTDD